MGGRGGLAGGDRKAQYFSRKPDGYGTGAEGFGGLDWAHFGGWSASQALGQGACGGGWWRRCLPIDCSRLGGGKSFTRPNPFAIWSVISCIWFCEKLWIRYGGTSPSSSGSRTLPDPSSIVFTRGIGARAPLGEIAGRRVGTGSGWRPASCSVKE